MSGVLNERKVKQAHVRFLRNHHRLINTEVNRAAGFIVQHVADKPGFEPRSGDLQRSVSTRIRYTTNTVNVAGRSRGVRYNAAIEEGAKPHVIRARFARALRFVWHGTVMYRRFVKHPGNKPYYFLRSAVFAGAHSFEVRMGLGMHTIAKRF